MKIPTSRTPWAPFVAAALLAVTAGCAKQNDPIAQADKKDVASGIPGPSIADTKAIAEDGFIYGLPLVMNYGVMYEYAVNRNSGQFKAPFNEINNEARVFTYKDTSIPTPNSDTPYSILFMDLRAEPMVLSVPAVVKSRYYSVMLCDANTFNFGYMGSRATASEAGDYLVVVPIGKVRHRPASRKCSSPRRSLRLRLTARSCSMRPICRTWSRSKRNTRFGRSRPF